MDASAEHEKDDEGGNLLLLWGAAERASSWALDGQGAVQSRFGNFLLADSFLLLSWATVYTMARERLAESWCWPSSPRQVSFLASCLRYWAAVMRSTIVCSGILRSRLNVGCRLS